ncbi:hypothetical protein GQ597_06060 [Gilliamella sp. Pra-s65]|uniref:hypothetical protein n=1 Tax=Gilliamella sp. Pra-s65 TaxID=2687316 RepID=UPI001365ADF6|nr:hypothetical protein [Gilliamella sp. Pra-s65]MWN90262.1 hypothetical protein [Gilliamella sp. Pra-s65]
MLTKSALFFAPLLLLSYTQGVQALTAYTSMTIEGSAPYLTFDGGQTKLTDTDSLLSIKLQDGTVYTRSTNPSTPSNPIRLPYVGSNLSHIETIVPPSQNSITMNDLVSQGYWRDDDGDGQGVGGVTASGSISVTFKDKNGRKVNRTDALDICNAPYKVTLTSRRGTLSTRYGVPRSSSFSGATVDYYINPNSSQPGICSVRPNLIYGTDRWAGPANIWSPTKGFLVQSTSPSSYGQNFPTTGSDGLYFDLDVGGVDVAQLTWSSVTHSGITATVSVVAANDRWIPSNGKGKRVTRVTLRGPKASSSQISSSNPGRITVPSLPQTFELVGRDRSGNEVRYGFVLRQWFVNRGNQNKPYRDQLAWCNSLGYRIPRVRDLTNAKCGVNNSEFPCVNGIDGATPSSLGSDYQRHIGAGFFTEWGYMDHYADAGFVYFYYWTSDAAGSSQFYADPVDGNVFSGSASLSRYGLCTAP